MDTFRLDVPYVPGEGIRTLLLLAAGLLVISGVVGSLVTATLMPLIGAAVGCLIYAGLLLKHPTYQYITALTIDHRGICYMPQARPGAASQKFAWQEVKAVSARLTSAGDENPGLEVTTTRFGPKGMPVLIPIGSESECLAALRVAQTFVGPHAQSAA